MYAVLVDEALRSEEPMNYEVIERRAEKLLQTTPPFPIIIDLRESPASPVVRRRVRFFRCGRAWKNRPKLGRFRATSEDDLGLPPRPSEAGSVG